jgi:hypothetical protein
MAIGTTGRNLILLISQLRAGSTLLQRMLANHGDIHSLPEPWIALPSLYALYSKKIDRRYKLEYSRYWARTAIESFVKRLPGGEEDYLNGFRLMLEHWYNCAMSGSGKRFFLDKCPRYYHIIPELRKVLPDAVFIFLLRNPLAVLNSIANVCGRTGCHMREFQHDLLSAPRRIVDGIKLSGEGCVVIRYEDLLTNPEAPVRKICEKLNIDFIPGMLKYGPANEFKDSYGYCMQPDRYAEGEPDAGNADRWALDMKDPQRWRLLDDYIRYVGRDIISAMGYSYEDLRRQLDTVKPNLMRLFLTAPLLRSLKER